MIHRNSFAVRLAAAVLSIILVCGHQPPTWAGELPENLDLASTNRTESATTSGIISAGGAAREIVPGALVTPAEAVALQQVAGPGQTIQLSEQGNAVGGSFALTQLPEAFSTFVIPKGVTAIHDITNGSTLNVSGLLANGGTLYVSSSNAAVTDAVIKAASIQNQVGALISSVVPQQATPVNLSLIAGTLSNLGKMESSGSLSVIASASIQNALPAGVAGPPPTMQSAGSLSLIAPEIVNAGLLSSLAATANLTSQSVVNTGTISALSEIAVRNMTAADSLSVQNTLGQLIAQDRILFEVLQHTSDSLTKPELNVNGGSLSASIIQMLVPEGHLHLGDNIDLSGSNAWGNAGNASELFAASGGNMSISSNITARGGNSITGTGGSGGIIRLAAGESLSIAGAVDVSGGSGQSGGTAGLMELIANDNVTITATINAVGGSASNGIGSSGGTISAVSSFGSIVLSSAMLNANGAPYNYTESSTPSAPSGGTIDLYARRDIDVDIFNTLSVQGGATSNPTAQIGGSAGRVLIGAQGNISLQGSVWISGSDAETQGGAGGTLMVNAGKHYYVDFNRTQAYGGGGYSYTTSGVGGKGATVDLWSAGTGTTTGNLSVNGGSGVTNGGTGGKARIGADGDLDIQGSVTASGGYVECLVTPGPDISAGRGGMIEAYSVKGWLSVAGTLEANGGDAFQPGEDEFTTSGRGGDIIARAYKDVFLGDVIARGGDLRFQNPNAFASRGGTISVISETGSVSGYSLNVRGGDAEANKYARGGDGGSATVQAAKSITLWGEVTARGGNAYALQEGAIPGNGGIVDLAYAIGYEGSEPDVRSGIATTESYWYSARPGNDGQITYTILPVVHTPEVSTDTGYAASPSVPAATELAPPVVEVPVVDAPPEPAPTVIETPVVSTPAKPAPTLIETLVVSTPPEPTPTLIETPVAYTPPEPAPTLIETSVVSTQPEPSPILADTLVLYTSTEAALESPLVTMPSTPDSIIPDKASPLPTPTAAVEMNPHAVQSPQIQPSLTVAVDSSTSIDPMSLTNIQRTVAYTPSTVTATDATTVSTPLANAANGDSAITVDKRAAILEVFANVDGATKAFSVVGVQGSVVIAPGHQAISIETETATVHITASSIAVLIKNEHSLAILCLHDSRHGGVSVIVGNKRFAIPPGKQVVLAQSGASDFDQVNPGYDIAYRQPKPIDFGNGTRGFASDFSIYSCFAAIKPLRAMLTASNPATRAQANKALKNAVILGYLTSSAGPYKKGKTVPTSPPPSNDQDSRNQIVMLR